MFLIYYLICLVYCLYHLAKRYKTNDSTAYLTPDAGLHALMIFATAWLLAPIDFSLTWIRWYKEAEQNRIKKNNIY